MKNQKIFSFKTKIFRRKISFCGPNVRYLTPLHPALHPVTIFQSKQNLILQVQVLLNPINSSDSNNIYDARAKIRD